jgi:hypothetical protein
VVPALALLGIAIVTFPSGGGPPYAGALPLVGIVSAVLLAGLQVESRARRAVGAAPLRAIGRVSYGLYVYHLPIYVVFDADRLGVDGALLTVCRLAITGVVAVLSYHLLELPIRRMSTDPLPTIGYAAAGTLSIALIALGALPSPSPGYWNLDRDEIAAAEIRLDEQSLEPLTWIIGTEERGDPGTRSLSRPARILVAGDSTAGALGAGVVLWAGERPDLAQVEIDAVPGCGLLRGGERLVGAVMEPVGECADWVSDLLVPAVERTAPDVVVLMVTTWDLLDRRWDDDGLLDPIDARYRARLVADYSMAVEQIFAAGASSVVLVDHPVPDLFWKPATGPQEDIERHAVLAGVRREVAGREQVEVIGLDRWLTDAGLDGDRTVRPDGVHLAPAAATRVVHEFLGPALLEIAVASNGR